MTQQSPSDIVRHASTWSILCGVAFIILGVLAVGSPALAAVAVNAVIAWLIVLAGVVHLSADRPDLLDAARGPGVFARLRQTADALRATGVRLGVVCGLDSDTAAAGFGFGPGDGKRAAPRDLG